MKRIILVAIFLTLFLTSCNASVDLKYESVVCDMVNDSVVTQSEVDCWSGVESCNTSVDLKYESVVCDMVNDGVVTQAEVDYWSGVDRQRIDAPKTKVFNYCGETYNLKYIGSCFGALSPVEIDKYYSPENDVSFWFRSDTGEFVYFGLHSWWSHVDDYRKKPLTLEEARSISDSTISEYINPDEYTVTETTSPKAFYDNDYYTNYQFEYTKVINGLITMDSISVTLSLDGSVIFLSKVNAGLFSAPDEITIDEKAVDLSVERKIKDIYEKKYDYSTTQGFRKLTYTPDGNLAVITCLEIELTPKNTHNSFVSGIVIATLIS